MCKNILITGGAGFIGTHTALLLLSKGYKITIIDSFINSDELAINKLKKLSKEYYKISKINIDLFKGDIRNKEFLNEIFLNAKKKNTPIDAVIHLAGLKSVRESVKYPLKYWNNNVNGSINLVNVMEENNCRTMVFSSSATIYGLNKNNLLSEENKLNPINPYGMTKFVIEKLLNDIHKTQNSGWGIINLRYFNPIGAHPSGEIGENPLDLPNNIFPLLTRVAIKKTKELKIFGNDWPTKDGTPIRDYIHIMDLASGHLLALEFLFNNQNDFHNINLGTGKGTTVLELIKTFKKVNSIDVPYIFSRRREGDCAKIVANNLLAKSILDWEPKYSIEDMCTDGWNWQLKNPNGYSS
tara:strand:- start:1965 stop:3026 length:1062 start_codon:yes stop_codon:yes gene_type:complete